MDTMSDFSNTVVNFYKENANNFSKTRVFPWPSTMKFLDNLPENSKVLDIGCGNGRNLFYRKDLEMVGVELSSELCKIVLDKGGVIHNSNMTELPFESNSFDAIICVAVYHHLDNDRDRKKAISEMYRVLKASGKAFIQVWAMEQPFSSRRKFLKRNEIVPWKNKSGEIINRYYRIYPKGELEIEIQKMNNNFKIINIIYEEGYWINILEK